MSTLFSQRSVRLFCLAECALYGTFLYFDLLRPWMNTVYLKYAAILVCFVTALWNAFHGGDKLVAWALGFTVGADTFLLLLDRWYLVGVLLFYVVQMLYLLRLAQVNGGRVMLLGRAGLFTGLLIVLLWTDSFTSVTAASALYISHFFFNVLQSRKLGQGGGLFFWGLLLYFLCDLCVGLYNSVLPLSGFLYRLVGVGMWFFYLPGQVLIVLSGLTSLEGDIPDDQAK